MCRSIKTLRPPFVDEVNDDDMRAAALQYVRKISGMRAPARANVEPFDRAVTIIAAATRELLEDIQVRPRPKSSTDEPIVDRAVTGPA